MFKQDNKVFEERREIFLNKLDGKAAIIPGANLVKHHADCEYPFRQDSNFWYLTGFDEPDAIALFLSHKPKGERFIMFVAPKDVISEVWQGFRWGLEGAEKEFKADKAHELVRASISTKRNERQIQGLLEGFFLEKGARGPAYNSIVASGDNACILHYTLNNSPLNKEDLLLVDAGCSLTDYYNGDITRTIPIGGKFTKEQKVIYEIVLSAQKNAIKSAVTGSNSSTVHNVALKILIEGLREIGLLAGSTEEIIENQSYKHLYMHRTGHWLGLDVHDVGAYRMGDYEVPLQNGMILTVEPGIYISDRIPVPEGQPLIDEKWKGIGIRIEDDVLVQDANPEVLSTAALKEISDLEF